MTTTTQFTGQPFATETLITDTIAYDVLHRTAKTIIVRRRGRADVKPTHAVDRVFEFPTVTRPDAPAVRLRLRKDGTYRRSPGGHALRFTNTVPVERIDYAY